MKLRVMAISVFASGLLAAVSVCMYEKIRMHTHVVWSMYGKGGEFCRTYGVYSGWDLPRNEVVYEMRWMERWYCIRTTNCWLCVCTHTLSNERKLAAQY